MNFQSLNDDCVRHIFKYLDLDQLYAMSNVCKSFRDIVNHSNMKLSYVLTVDTSPLANNCNKIIRDFLRRTGHHIERLRIVEVERERHDPSEVYHMMNLLQTYCYNVKHLRFEYCAGIKLVDIERHFDLRTLELENSTLCASPTLNGLDTTITGLTLNSCTSADIKKLLEYLQVNRKMRHLRLLNCCLCMIETVTGFCNSDIISSLQHLQCLTLDYSVKSTNLQLIGELDNLKKIFLLHFNENKLTKLFDRFATNERCRLQEIHFHMCTISDDHIYESLSKLKSLEVMEMCKNFGMTSNHLNILSGCENLIQLRCFDCIQVINDEGILHVVRKCEKLQMLAVYWCTGVTLQTVDKIEEINKLIGRTRFTFKIGGRTGINWNDSGPLPSISKVRWIIFLELFFLYEKFNLTKFFFFFRQVLFFCKNSDFSTLQHWLSKGVTKYVRERTRSKSPFQS